MNKGFTSITFQVIVHVLAIVALLPQFCSWGSFLVFIFSFWLTGCFGLTLGYHRLLAHRSFEVPLWFERIIATLGALSYQFGPLRWVSIHRQHHRHSDTELDPHNSEEGFWWSHMGWLFKNPPYANREYVSDIIDDPYYRWLDKWFWTLQIPLGVLLYSLGGWSFVLWGIPVRLVYTFHATVIVNSVTHKWGYQTFSEVPGLNNALISLISFGEGWHNNHHEYPESAKLSYLKNEFDITWYHIVLLKKLGLAKNVRLPGNI